MLCCLLWRREKFWCRFFIWLVIVDIPFLDGSFVSFPGVLAVALLLGRFDPLGHLDPLAVPVVEALVLAVLAALCLIPRVILHLSINYEF